MATSSTSAAAATTTTVLTGRVTPYDSVLSGQCFNQLPDSTQRPYAVVVTACENPHTHEAFAKLTSGAGPKTAGAPYPGDDAVRVDADQQCLAAFETWMGTPWTHSEFDVQSWWPSATSWANRRDRAVLCTAYRQSGGRVTGSVAGAKR